MTTLVTRKPTGRAPWPILLIAGVEKAGKSYACAAASAAPQIERTLWVGIGEDDPDEYSGIPGADFEIVQHDGSYAQILASIEAAVSEPGTNLLVVDSMTKLWDLLSNMAQSEANQRAARKGRRGDEARIDMDLWNVAKKRHQAVVNALKGNAGPVLLTARLDNQVLMDDNGQPTKHRDWKVKAEKNLVYDVSAIIELHERGKAYITGVRSLHFQGDPSLKAPLPGFSVIDLWGKLRVGESGPRHFDRNDGIDVEAPELERAGLVEAANQFREEAEPVDGQPIRRATQTRLFARIGERDDIPSDRDGRLAAISAQLGRTVASSSDLTEDEGQRLLAWLK